MSNRIPPGDNGRTPVLSKRGYRYLFQDPPHHGLWPDNPTQHGCAPSVAQVADVTKSECWIFWFVSHISFTVEEQVCFMKSTQILFTKILYNDISIFYFKGRGPRLQRCCSFHSSGFERALWRNGGRQRRWALQALSEAPHRADGCFL